MHEEKHYIFKAETILDLPVWKEVCTAFEMTAQKTMVLRIICILLLSICTIAVLMTPSMSLSVLTGAMIGGILVYFRWQKNKNGGKAYQELLSSNGGMAPHSILYFTDTGIDHRNVCKGTDTHWEYGQVTGIIDGGRIFLIILESKQFFIIDPRWLKGGTWEGLTAFLVERCTAANKKIQKITLGKIISAVYRTVCILLLALSLIFAAMQVLPTSPIGLLANDASVKESAAILEEMDIHCSEEIIAEIEQWAAESGDYFVSSTTKDRFLALLCSAGFGSYVWDTLEWTPPTGGVYWLDLEAFDIQHMYTQYLTGLSAISEGELVITDIQENHDHVDWNMGSGEIDLSFTLNGVAHRLTIPMDYDWYDLSALEEINRIINSCGDKQVYAASDSGQGILVFYRSPQWAAEFTKLTGIPLSKKVSSLWHGLPF